MNKIKIHKFGLIVLLFSSFISLFLCLDDSSILIIQFQSKSLQKEVDSDEEDEHETHWQDESDLPFPVTEEYNSAKFLNEWFYNGMYIKTEASSQTVNAYVNIQNTKFSFEKCNENRLFSKASYYSKNTYDPLKSSTYFKKDEKTGNDIFSFYGDLNYKTKIKIGQEKGKGLDFQFNENDKNDDLCGNLGLNINLNSDNTNFIYQLKNKKYIKDYIWTLDYQTKEDGIIVLGTEPHFYGDFYMSQFCTIKAIQNQSPETAWSFKMDEIITYDSNKNKISFSKNKVDFLIDRGLIIGTDEYKNKIDEIFFNDLISNKICFSEIREFDDIENNAKGSYYIYYCDDYKFTKHKSQLENTYYNNFPNLDFYVKEHNYTFSLNKGNLFYTKDKKVFFLIIFKKSTTENNIWKLGEPFFSHFPLTFNQEKKNVGFYNFNLKQIPNDEYMKNIEEKKNESSPKNKIILYVTLIVVGIAIIVGAFFLGKKINEKRKQRANELGDEDFEYSSEKQNNEPINDS